MELTPGPAPVNTQLNRQPIISSPILKGQGMKQSTWFLLGVAALCICIGILLAWILIRRPSLLDGFQNLSSPIISDSISDEKTPITVIPPSLVDALNDQVNLKRIQIEDNILAATDPVRETTLQYALFYKDKNVNDALSFIMSYYNDSLLFSDFESLAALYMKESLSTFEDILFTTMYGISSMLEKNTFPESWSRYALKVSGNNPFTARKFMLDNYSDMDKLVLQGTDPEEYKRVSENNATWTLDRQGGAWNANGLSNGVADPAIRSRICKELESATELFRGKLEGLRTAAQDIRQSIEAANKAKEENWNAQMDSMDSTKASTPCIQGGSPNADCKRLASIDSYLHDLVPDYQQAKNDLIKEGIPMRDKLTTLIKVADLYRCPFVTDLSGFNNIPLSFLDPLGGEDEANPEASIATYTGEFYPETLNASLKSLSPYYISPDVTNYVSKSLLIRGDTDDSPYEIINNSYGKLITLNNRL